MQITEILDKQRICLKAMLNKVVWNDRGGLFDLLSQDKNDFLPTTSAPGTVPLFNVSTKDSTDLTVPFCDRQMRENDLYND